MKLFTRKGIVALGATVAIATTGIVAPAQAEETTATETTTASSTVETTPEKPLSKDEVLENNQNAQTSSDFECGYYDGDDYHKTTGKFANSLKCTWENGGPTERLGLITGFATLVTTVIGVASTVFNLVKKVAPDLF